MGDTQAASGGRVPEVSPKASRDGKVREGCLEEVTMVVLFSATSPAQGDQLILVCWGRVSALEVPCPRKPLSCGQPHTGRAPRSWVPTWPMHLTNA